jgi:hypothetical protein
MENNGISCGITGNTNREAVLMFLILFHGVISCIGDIKLINA